MITAPLNVELPALPRSDQQSLKGSHPDLVNKPIRGSLYYDIISDKNKKPSSQQRISALVL